MKKLELILIALSVLIADQKLKSASEKQAALHGCEETAAGKCPVCGCPACGCFICGGFIRRRHHHNPGFMMGIAKHHQDKVARVSFFSTIALFLVFLRILFLPGHAFTKIGLALQLGGACSNTYDRVKRKYVIDYFSFRIGEGLRGRLCGELAENLLFILPGDMTVSSLTEALDRFERICFNIGDMAIFAGAALVLRGAKRAG